MHFKMFREIKLGKIKLFYFSSTRCIHLKEKPDDVFLISPLSQYLTSDAYAETLGCHFPGLLSKT